MIEKLTQDQENKIPEYLKKWLEVGYRTESIDQKKAKESVNFIYTEILNMKTPKYYIFLDSPMACNLAINFLKNTNLELGSQLDSQLDIQLYSQLYSQLSSPLISQLGSQLDSQLDSQLTSQLRSQLRSQLYSQLYSQLRSQLRSQLSSQLYSQLDSQLTSQLRSQLRSQLGSQLDSQLRSQLGKEFFYDSISNINPRWYYYWTYDFILNELFKSKVKDFSKFSNYMNCLKEVHLTYMFDDIVFFSNFPEYIKLDSNDQLHSENSYALKYRDNYGLFSINGEVKETKRILKNRLSKKMLPNAIEDDGYLLVPEL